MKEYHKLKNHRLLHRIVVGLELSTIITGNAVYKPAVGYAAGGRPYGRIYMTPEAYRFRDEIKDQLPSIPDLDPSKVLSSEVIIIYVIPQMETQAGLVRHRKYDLTNITKVVEDAIVEHFNVDDSLHTSMHSHKIPGEKYLTVLDIRYYGK